VIKGHAWVVSSTLMKLEVLWSGEIWLIHWSSRFYDSFFTSATWK